MRSRRPRMSLSARPRWRLPPTTSSASAHQLLRHRRQARDAVLADADDGQPTLRRAVCALNSHGHAPSRSDSRRHDRSVRAGASSSPATPASRRRCRLPAALRRPGRSRCRRASAASAASTALRASCGDKLSMWSSMPRIPSPTRSRPTPSPPAADRRSAGLDRAAGMASAARRSLAGRARCRRGRDGARSGPASGISQPGPPRPARLRAGAATSLHRAHHRSAAAESPAARHPLPAGARTVRQGRRDAPA